MRRVKEKLVFVVLLAVITLAPHARIPDVQGLTWSTGTPLTPSLTIETKPYVVEDRQGVLWAVWESYRSSNWDIYGRRFDGASWLSEEPLTSHASRDLNPALAQLSNGTLLLIWASDRSGEFKLYSKRYNGGVWSVETPVTSGAGRDSTPALLESRNGTLWLFWTRESISGSSVVRDIYYKTYTNSLWSSDVPLASSAASELQPSITEVSDGTIWVAYSSSRAGNLDMYSRTFSGTWSSESPLTFSTDDDRQPWIMQDLNGTLWIFWSRCVTTIGQLCQDDVFYKTSSNLGASWSLEVQFTKDPTGVEVFDGEPAAIHARDKRIYLFWVTTITGDGGDVDVYYSTSEPIPIHDVGLKGAAASPTNTKVGGTIRVDVTATNLGDYTEPVRINGYFENVTRTLFASASITLPAGTSTTVPLYWVTDGVTPASKPSSYYKIIVLLEPVPGESVRRQSDNTADAGNVRVLPTTIPGDIDRDGDVDIIDAARLAIKFDKKIGREDIDGDCDVDIIDASILAYAFDSRLGDARWNPKADLDGDGDVDIIDASSLAIKFGAAIGPEDIDGDCDVDIIDASILALWFDTKS